MNGDKLNRVLEVLLEGLDSKLILKTLLNKMKNQAKRQAIQELLNLTLGNGYIDKEGFTLLIIVKS